MASRRIPASAVVRHFQGDESCLSEVFFEGSDDELGMEDIYSDSDDEESPGEYAKPHARSWHDLANILPRIMSVCPDQILLNHMQDLGMIW